MRSLLRPFAAVALLAGVAAGPAPADVELPSIGSPVDQVLSPREEAEVGARLMERARRQLDLNDDPEIAGYVDELGARLAASVDPGSSPVGGFTFFVVRDERINAFAAPGGYIGIHSGLILAAENEAQLAGVIAHEIAHVTQRHIAKAYAASQRNQYTTLAAVLAGLILGSQNPQAGQAAIATGMATEAQRQINYTRSNEYEADRIGIAILARAGYDPAGMAGMFEVLMASAGSSADAVPEFLRTHPLSSNRVAEAQSRADELRPASARRDSLEFHLMQRRLEVLRAEQPRALAQRWRRAEPDGGGHAAVARRYGVALLEHRNGQAATAVERLAALRNEAPDNLHLGLAHARALHAAGETGRALEVWRHFEALHPLSFAVIDTGADLLTAAGRPVAALDRLTEYLRSAEQPPPEAWRRLAEAANAADRPIRSHEALGEYYARVGSLDRAMRQLELAIDRAPADSPDALRLEARLEQVRERQRERMRNSPVSGG